METAKKWDVDDDGIIDNGGFADQTFDAWTMTGARYHSDSFDYGKTNISFMFFCSGEFVEIKACHVRIQKTFPGVYNSYLSSLGGGGGFWGPEAYFW